MGDEKLSDEQLRSLVFRLSIPSVSDSPLLLVNVEPSTNFQWDVIEEKTQKSLNERAIAEFDGLADRFRTPLALDSNRSLLMDRLQAIREEDLLNRSIVKIESPRSLSRALKNQLLYSWRRYKEYLNYDFVDHKQTQLVRGRGRTAEFYAHPDLILKGAAAALADPKTAAFIRSKLVQRLSEFNVPTRVELKDAGESFIWNQKRWTSTIQEASFILTPHFKPEALDFSLTPLAEAKVSANGNQRLAQFKVRIRASGVDLRVDFLSASTDLLKTSPYLEIWPRDDVHVGLTVPADKPFTVAGYVILKSDRSLFKKSKSDQDLSSRLDLELSDYQTPLQDLQIADANWGKNKFNAKEADLRAMLAQPEVWAAVANEVNGSMADPQSFAQAIVGRVKDGIYDRYKDGLTLEDDFVAISTPAAAETFQVLPYKFGDGAADPAINPNIILSVHLKIPLKLSRPPEITAAALKDQPALASQILLTIENPKVEMTDLKFFGKTHPIETSDLGARFQFAQKDPLDQEKMGAKDIDIQAAGSAALNGPLKLNLLDLKTRGIDNLFIPNLEIKLGNEWKRADNLGREFLVTNAPFVRKELSTKGVGRELAGLIETETKNEVSDHLNSMELPFVDQEFTAGFDIWKFPVKGTLKASGSLKTPGLKLDDFVLTFKDFEKEEPQCKGTYILSAGLDLRAPKSIRIETGSIDMDVTAESLGLTKKGHINIHHAKFDLGLADSQESPRLTMDVDLCQSFDGVSVDMVVRSFKHNLDKLKPQHIDLKEVASSDADVEVLATLMGWTAGRSRDQALSDLLEGLWRQNQDLLSREIRSQIVSFLRERIPYHIKRAQGPVAKLLSSVDRYDGQVAQYLYNIGTYLRAPLEKVLVDRIQQMMSDYEAPGEDLIERQFQNARESVVHIGNFVGETLERKTYSVLMNLLEGDSSEQALSVEIERILNPAPFGDKLASAFDLPIGVGRSGDAKPEARDQPTTVDILSMLSECPIVGSPAPFLETYDKTIAPRLSETKRQDLLKLIKDRCVQDDFADDDQNREGVLKKALDESKGSINSWLEDAASQKYFAVPETSLTPLVASNSDDGERAINLHPQVSDLKVISVGPNHTNLLQATIFSPEFSNGTDQLNDDVGAEQALKLIGDNRQQSVLRISRQRYNQILLKIDWVKLINDKVPGARLGKIDIPVAPYIDEHNQLHFKASYRIVNLLFKIGAKFLHPETAFDIFERLFMREPPDSKRNQIVDFAVSLFDLDDWVAIQINGTFKTELKIDLVNTAEGLTGVAHFMPIDAEELKASDRLEGLTRIALKQMYQEINQKLVDLVKSLKIPTVQALGSEWELARLTLIEGDIYVVIRRKSEDDPDDSKI